MNDKITINGVEYLRYSLESANYGGISKSFAISQLKHAGIKVSTNRDYCYTPYVGHYALLVEAAKEKEADKILFGIGEQKMVKIWMWFCQKIADHYNYKWLNIHSKKGYTLECHKAMQKYFDWIDYKFMFGGKND